MTLWEKILKFFGLAKYNDYFDAIKTIAKLEDDRSNDAEVLDQMTAVVRRQQSINDSLVDQVNKLTGRIQSVEFQTMEQYLNENKSLKDENEEVKKSIEESNKFYISVQKQVTELLKTSESFGFPKSMAFPGSTSIDTRTITNSGDSSNIVIKGKSVLMDEVGAELQNTPSLTNKIMILNNTFTKYGIMSKIMRDVIMNGGIEYTLGYNDNCTALEAYYQVVVRKPQVCFTQVIEPAQEEMKELKEGESN